MFKSVASILLCLVVIMFSACSDPNENIERLTFNDLKPVDKPLTQSDIDSYMQVAPEVRSFVWTDGKAAAKIYDKYGISRLRYLYIQAKISAILLFTGTDGAQDGGWDDYLEPPSEADRKSVV